MANQVNGFQSVPHGSYDEFRNFALNNGVNVDYAWGNQCYDICAILWYQYGLRLNFGPLGYAYEAWTVSRNANAVGPFIAIDGVQNIKRGDVLVFNAYGSYYTGHICFADEDYHGNYLNVLGQNQGQGVGWGVPSNVIPYYVGNFLGIFRNTAWSGTPPTPPTPPAPRSSFGSFPWVLRAGKLRNVIK